MSGRPFTCSGSGVATPNLGTIPTHPSNCSPLQWLIARYIIITPTLLYWGLALISVQQIVKPTPRALFCQILTMFSGTLNVGNVQFYFPDSSVLNSRGRCSSLALFVAPPHLTFLRHTPLNCFQLRRWIPNPFELGLKLVNCGHCSNIWCGTSARHHLGTKGPNSLSTSANSWAIKETLAHSNWQARIKVKHVVDSSGLTCNNPIGYSGWVGGYNIQTQPWHWSVRTDWMIFFFILWNWDISFLSSLNNNFSSWFLLWPHFMSSCWHNHMIDSELQGGVW